MWLRYRGKGTKWFKGRITRDNYDGTFDIDYDDGDRDAGALATNIRLQDGGDALRSPTRGGGGSGGGGGGGIREGSKVEARYRGKSRYYPGVVRRENRDGTFDIDYDDGEKEMFVAVELIRLLDAPSNVATKLCVGDKIEAL